MTKTKTREVWAVEVMDPADGGKAIRFPFAFRAHAELWAREEREAAAELGIHGVTTRVFRATID